MVLEWVQERVQEWVQVLVQEWVQEWVQVLVQEWVQMLIHQSLQQLFLAHLSRQQALVRLRRSLGCRRTRTVYGSGLLLSLIHI